MKILPNILFFFQTIPKLFVKIVFIVATGQVLDSNHDGKVYTLPYNYGDFQKWNIIQSGQGWARIQNQATGKCLDSNHGQQVYTLEGIMEIFRSGKLKVLAAKTLS